MRPRSSSPWGRSPTRRRRSSTTSAPQGRRSAASRSRRSGRSRPTAVAERSWRGPRGRRRRAHRRAGRADNPLTRESQSRPLRAGADGRAGPAGRVLSRPASGHATSRAGDLVGGLRLAGRRAQPATRHYAVLGIRHPLALRARPARPATGGCVQPARPLDRRLRLGDDEQARGHARGRALRTPGPGLPALRVREEGAADDLLPDGRRRRQSASTASSTTSSSCRSTTSRPSARATRWPGSSTAAPLRPVAAHRSGRDLGVDPGRTPGRRSSARRIRVAALDTAALARRHTPRDDLARSGCRASPWSACSCA